jgi:hypothetical protein
MTGSFEVHRLALTLFPEGVRNNEEQSMMRKSLIALAAVLALGSMSLATDAFARVGGHFRGNHFGHFHGHHVGHSHFGGRGHHFGAHFGHHFGRGH